MKKVNFSEKVSIFIDKEYYFSINILPEKRI